MLPTRPRHGEQAALAFHHVTNLPKPRWIELSELDRYSSPTAQAFLDLAAKPLPQPTRPRHGEQAAVAFHLRIIPKLESQKRP